MPWCPKCKIEYREGYDHCADCGCALIGEQPGPDSPGHAVDKSNWGHLIFIYSETEADIVMGLLETADIPVIKAYKGAGVLQKVYTGRAAGVDLFVPLEKLDEAKALLQAKAED